MADDSDDTDEIAAGASGESSAEDAESLIDLLRSEARRPADGTPGPATGGSPAIKAVIRAMPDKNEVILGLIDIKEPVNRTSISLSADTTVRLGERLLLEALSLPNPPDPRIVRTTLARLLKALEKS
jgi:hypothetical protein